MKGPSGDVVHLVALGEGAVAALMAENPDTGADETLDEAVDHPGGGAQDGVLDAGDVGESSPDEASDHGEVADDIVVGSHERRLEAVSRDGISDGLDIREDRLVGLL